MEGTRPLGAKGQRLHFPRHHLSSPRPHCLLFLFTTPISDVHGLSQLPCMFDPRLPQGRPRRVHTSQCVLLLPRTPLQAPQTPSPQAKLPPPPLAISTSQGPVSGQGPAPPVTQSAPHCSGESSMRHSCNGLGGTEPQQLQGQQGVQAWGPEGPESHFRGRVSSSRSLSSAPPPYPSRGWRCKTKRVPQSRLHNSASQQRPIFKS